MTHNGWRARSAASSSTGSSNARPIPAAPPPSPSEARMTPDVAMEQFPELIAEPLSAIVSRFKAQQPGGRAIAVYPVWAPVEVIHAAGMLPLSLLGGGTSVELTHADARFQSFVCSIAKSTLELGFQGRLAGVDGLVFSNICDVARNLSSIYQRNFPGTFV